MKISSVLRVAALALLLSGRLLAQQTFPVYSGTVPNSKPSTVQETSLTLASGGVRIANVVQPTLTAFLPVAGTANGTAVIICPGGGYARLSIDSEGYDVAKRLNEMGVTAFVLKYRLPNDESQPIMPIRSGLMPYLTACWRTRRRACWASIRGAVDLSG